MRPRTFAVLLAPALLVMGLAGCDGEDPVNSVVRDVSTANHAAAAAAEADARARTVPGTVPPVSAAAVDCDVEVAFGSSGGGVDSDLRAQILAVANADPDVSESSEKRRGREGESTLCLKATDAGASDRLYGMIAARLPSTGARAPTTVRHRDGRSRATTDPTPS